MSEIIKVIDKREVQKKTKKTMRGTEAKAYSLPIFTANETITNLMWYELSQEEQIYLKQFYTFQSNQIKFETLKSSLPLKRFIILLLTTFS